MMTLALPAWRSIAGALLSGREREWLKDQAHAIAADFDAPLILNIGIYRGASMHCLRAGAPGATLVGIDVGIALVQEPDALRAELIRKDSRQMGSWSRPIHFLFVDGGHREPVIRSDIRLFGKHVVIGGIMAFHDYHRPETYLRWRALRFPHRAPLGVRSAVDDLCTEALGWEVAARAGSIRAFRKVDNET